MKYIVPGCPAFEEYKVKIVGGGSLQPEKMDFCSKTKQPCLNVDCPMKQSLRKLRDIKRDSSEYNTQFEIQQLIEFFRMQDIPE